MLQSTYPNVYTSLPYRPIHTTTRQFDWTGSLEGVWFTRLAASALDLFVYCNCRRPFWGQNVLYLLPNCTTRFILKNPFLTVYCCTLAHVPVLCVCVLAVIVCIPGEGEGGGRVPDGVTLYIDLTIELATHQPINVQHCCMLAMYVCTYCQTMHVVSWPTGVCLFSLQLLAH